VSLQPIQFDRVDPELLLRQLIDERALLPLLERGKEPRIINVSSGAGQLAVVKTHADMPPTG
jgi:hypothetical protein